MNLKKEKKGQAAIEFLMTYGWMLLVVLIVGALIFSFVDFGSLLPNRIDMNNNIRASATESFASDSTGNVTVVFTYTGAQRVEIDPADSTITPDTGSQCTTDSIRNVDTTDTGTTADPSAFLNGHTGVMLFNCPDGLLENDVLQGNIEIGVTSLKTGITTPSTGPLRITIVS